MIIKINDISLAVDYRYLPAEPRTGDNPGWPAEVNIDAVSTLEDPQDISILLADWVLNQIEKACMADVRQSKDEALERKAESLFFDNLAA